MTKKKSNIVIDNNLDSFSKKYMNYILYPLQKLLIIMMKILLKNLKII